MIENNPKSKVKRYLMIGLTSLMIASCSPSNNPNNSENLDKKLDSVLTELSNDPEAMNRNYDKLAILVEKDLINHPEYGDGFIISSLDSIKKNNLPIGKKTYVVIFNEIKNKAEENPEVMDFFGENAQRYMEKKVLDKYLGPFAGTFETLEKAREYLKEKLEGK